MYNTNNVKTITQLEKQEQSDIRQDVLPRGEATRIGSHLGLTDRQVISAYKSGMYKLRKAYRDGKIDVDIDDILAATLTENNVTDLRKMFKEKLSKG